MADDMTDKGVWFLMQVKAHMANVTPFMLKLLWVMVMIGLLSRKHKEKSATRPMKDGLGLLTRHSFLLLYLSFYLK
jgi:hypothetical protein